MKNIFIIAGESSGDQHAAKYVKEHKKINPNINFTGIGQNALENEGVDLIFNSDQIAVVGIIEVISKYFLIKKAMKIATDYLKVNRPDLIILVDYVEFNLKIAEFAKKLKIPVLFYIAPQVWAWRENRIMKISNVVDYLAVVLPFEKQIFDKHMKNVYYVGHPLLENKDLEPTNISFDQKKLSLGIFPGSRESEIKNNLFMMLDCVKLNKNLDDKYRDIKIFYSSDNSKRIMLSMLPKHLQHMLISGKDLNSIKQCKKAITASGTVTLELALMGIPMIIAYRLSPLTFLIMKNMVKIKFIGLVNLILGSSLGSHQVVKEFVQPDYNDQVDIMVELEKIDHDKEYRKNIENNYSMIRSKLKNGASVNLANLVENILISTV